MNLLGQKLNQSDIDAIKTPCRLGCDDGGIEVGGYVARPTSAGATDRRGVDPTEGRMNAWP